MKVEIKFETPERMCVEPVKNMINFIGEKVVYHLEGTNTVQLLLIMIIKSLN